MSNYISNKELSEPIEQTIKLEQNKQPTKLEKYSNFNFEECLGDDYNIDSPDNVSITKAMKSKSNKSKSYNKKKAVKSNYGTGYNPFEKKPEEVKYRIPPNDEKQNMKLILDKAMDVMFLLSIKSKELILSKMQ